MNRFVQHSKDTFKIGIALIISPIYKLFNKKKIYIIGERSDQCQDNGYHLFKYVRENFKDDKFYYCIEKESKQLDKIRYLGNILYYKSFKHYLYYILAEKLICAHVGSCTPDTAVIWKLESKEYINKKRFFIQHGITKEELPQLMYPKVKFETFVCGAKAEYSFVKDIFGFPEGIVKYLGLCRFDNLHNFKVKNQILVMPTWRQWFGMNGNNELSKEEFKKSEYFEKYYRLINNLELNEVLKENDMELIFYPHHEMQRYIELFKSKFNNVIIADKKIYDVQTLLKESEILITDYSSIAFDFAYMKKSVIYYQFDKEEYDSKHYAKGYFDYKEDGFGPIVEDINQLMYAIKISKKNDLKYVTRKDKFFELYDNKNCERHYKEIVEKGLYESKCYYSGI